MRSVFIATLCAMLAACQSLPQPKPVVMTAEQAQHPTAPTIKTVVVPAKPIIKQTVRIETPPPEVIVKPVIVEQPVTCRFTAPPKPAPLPTAPSVAPGHVLLPAQRISLLQNFIFVLLDYIKADHEAQLKQYQSYRDACQTPDPPKPATP